MWCDDASGYVVWGWFSSDGDDCFRFKLRVLFVFGKLFFINVVNHY